MEFPTINIVIEEPSAQKPSAAASPAPAPAPAPVERRLTLDEPERKLSRRNSQSRTSKEDISYKEIDLNAYFEEQHLKEYQRLKQDGAQTVFVRDLLAALKRSGVPPDSPLVRETIIGLEEDEELTYEQFSAAIKKNMRIETMLRDQLVIPNFTDFAKVIEEIYHETKDSDGGHVATYIPQLARVNPEYYGISVCTIDGQRFNIGDTQIPFCAQSTSKPITYAIACELRGEEFVHKHVGREPSGRNFNELVLNDDNLPHNPLINSGAIMSASLIKPEASMAERYEFAIEYWRKLMGGERPGFANAVYLSERATADTNFCLGYMMKEKGAFEKGCNIVQALELYFMFCSVELTAEQMSVVAASLANAGICPLTGEAVFQPQTVRNSLSMMASCGMYDFSGEFAFIMGFPAKSGVSGSLMIVIPGLMGICVFSPNLDKLGNTVRGIKFCEALVSRFKFHSFDNLVGLSDTGKIDPRREKREELSDDFVSFWWASSRGDLYRLRQLTARGVNPNCADYDKRTALHLAAGNGHLNVVQYLCFCGANPLAQDRYGATPLDDAVRFKKTQVAEFLKEFMTPTSEFTPFVPITETENQEAKSLEKVGRKSSIETIDVPSDLLQLIGTIHEYFLAVNTSLSTKTSKSGLRRYLKESGISADDPRITSLLQMLPSIFEQDQFVLLAENHSFLRRILEGNLIIPNFPALTKNLLKFYEQSSSRKDGEVSKRIPTLASVNPEQFGVAVCTLDGQRWSKGDSNVKFPVVNISKVMTYAMVLEEHGADQAHKHVGREPSGRNSNDLVLNHDGLPHNPLLDSGGIVCSSLIRPDLETPDRFEVAMEYWTQACGNKRPSFANANYLSEIDFCDRNYSLGYLMKAKEVFPGDTDIEEVIALYCMLNSIEMTAEDLSVVAATLANGGVCPLTGKRVFKPSTVRNVLSLMSSCGVYDYSGEWFFSIGVPAKSSSSGAVLIVIPNIMGICTWAPRLDKYGLSVSGTEFCRKVTNHFAFHTYDQVARSHHQDPRLYHGSYEESLINQLCTAASVGDITELRRVLAQGVDVNGADYDGRTGLHMAVAESQSKTAQFLILCGADVNKKDNWGHSPLDDANKLGNKEMVKVLDKAMKMKAASKKK